MLHMDAYLLSITDVLKCINSFLHKIINQSSHVYTVLMKVDLITADNSII